MRDSRYLINKYCLDRKEVLEEYKIIMDIHDLELRNIFFKILEVIPSHEKFNDLYKNNKLEISTQLFINQQLITAYNLGYVFEKSSYGEIINKYRELYSDLFREKQYNESLVSKKEKDNKKKVLK